MPAPITTHANRPYPPPNYPWALAMTWRHLLFIHYPISPARLRPFIPPDLEIETFEGRAWLGVVPFLMANTRARFTPPIPRISGFPELNVRTYVRSRRSGRPGVWFFSLDAAQPLAVSTARATFRLAYFNARMSAHEDPAGWIHYTSQRTRPHRDFTYGHLHTNDCRFDARYRPTAPASTAAPGSLESFFTDRYCLYAWTGKRLLRGEIHHAPWPLQPAECHPVTNTMAAQLGLSTPDLDAASPPKLHYVREIHVQAWLPTPDTPPRE